MYLIGLLDARFLLGLLLLSGGRLLGLGARLALGLGARLGL